MKLDWGGLKAGKGRSFEDVGVEQCKEGRKVTGGAASISEGHQHQPFLENHNYVSSWFILSLPNNLSRVSIMISLNEIDEFLNIAAYCFKSESQGHFTGCLSYLKAKSLHHCQGHYTSKISLFLRILMKIIKHSVSRKRVSHWITKIYSSVKGALVDSGVKSGCLWIQCGSALHNIAIVIFVSLKTFTQMYSYAWQLD